MLVTICILTSSLASLFFRKKETPFFMSFRLQYTLNLNRGLFTNKGGIIWTLQFIIYTKDIISENYLFTGKSLGEITSFFKRLVVLKQIKMRHVSAYLINRTLDPAIKVFLKSCFFLNTCFFRCYGVLNMTFLRWKCELHINHFSLFFFIEVNIGINTNLYFTYKIN